MVMPSVYALRGTKSVHAVTQHDWSAAVLMVAAATVTLTRSLLHPLLDIFLKECWDKAYKLPGVLDPLLCGLLYMRATFVMKRLSFMHCFSGCAGTGKLKHVFTTVTSVYSSSSEHALICCKEVWHELAINVY